MKNTNLYNGFNRAIIGVMKAIRTERNLKIELFVAIVVLAVSLFFPLTTFEFLLLIFTIVLVIVAELFNTAIEATLDALFGNRRNALVRKAKDVSAGAVFITSLNALLVAYLLFYSKIAHSGLNVFGKIKQTPVYLTCICLGLTLIITLVIKSFTSHNKALRGGMPSGHSAIAFGLATGIGFITEGYPYATLLVTIAYILAFLVAQSRVEGKIHTLTEVACGSLIGVFLTVIIFSMFK